MALRRQSGLGMQANPLFAGGAAAPGSADSGPAGYDGVLTVAGGPAGYDGVLTVAGGPTEYVYTESDEALGPVLAVAPAGTHTYDYFDAAAARDGRKDPAYDGVLTTAPAVLEASIL